jgi:Flp pilus assembly protein TadD
MFVFTKRVVIPTLLSVALATVSLAQAPQPAGQRQCQIDENSGQLGKALLSVSLAQTNQAGSKWVEAANHLRNAVKALEKPDKKNELGQKLVLGKALALWLNQPNVGATPTRGTLGFTTSPEAPIDLVAAIDSSFAPVEASNPACEAETTPWRAQQPWLTMVNQSIEAVNAGNIDSAEALANRSLRLHRKAPYAYMVLASAAQNRGQVARALQYHQQTIDAATDTNFAEARRQAMLTMANLAADVADTASGATRAQFARDARGAYERLIGEAPTSPQASQARGGLSRVLLLAGDTTAFRASYRDQIENPDKYDPRDILASGVGAARSQQWADAVALFEIAARQNPHNRDALANLAISYHELGELSAKRADSARGAARDTLAARSRALFMKMPPVVHRLVALDPSNTENWLLLARAYNALAKDAQRAKNTVLNRQMTDSTMKYFQRSEQVPINVTFTEFFTADTTARVRGTVEDRRGTTRPSGAGAGGAKPAESSDPKTYALRVEFLDKAGAVVASRDVSVGPVKPGERANFSAAADARGVVGFRYTVAP